MSEAEKIQIIKDILQNPEKNIKYSYFEYHNTIKIENNKQLDKIRKYLKVNYDKKYIKGKLLTHSPKYYVNFVLSYQPYYYYTFECKKCGLVLIYQSNQYASESCFLTLADKIKYQKITCSEIIMREALG